MPSPSLTRANIECTDASLGLYRCLACGHDWYVDAPQTGGTRVKGWWKCPSGCNSDVVARGASAPTVQPASRELVPVEPNLPVTKESRLPVVLQQRGLTQFRETAKRRDLEVRYDAALILRDVQRQIVSAAEGRSLEDVVSQAVLDHSSDLYDLIHPLFGETDATKFLQVVAGLVSARARTVVMWRQIVHRAERTFAEHAQAVKLEEAKEAFKQIVVALQGDELYWPLPLVEELGGLGELVELLHSCHDPIPDVVRSSLPLPESHGGRRGRPPIPETYDRAIDLLRDRDPLKTVLREEADVKGRESDGAKAPGQRFVIVPTQEDLAEAQEAAEADAQGAAWLEEQEAVREDQP